MKVWLFMLELKVLAMFRVFDAASFIFFEMAESGRSLVTHLTL